MSLEPACASLSQLEPASWLTECVKATSFPKLQLPSDRTKPKFENKGTRPEAMSTLTETSYLMAQLRPSRERKQKRRTKGGRVEQTNHREKPQRIERSEERESKEGMQRESPSIRKARTRMLEQT